ncbi:ISL3 family transposase [Saccharopolyspora spinosa]|uniref:ISL3 family transposase n=1 Tax=Saccharopolyspora spinosa TaxID=60894 RepID=UPI001934A7D8|nr:ISL3 family transposase [Saccharopolyspora spinosa]
MLGLRRRRRLLVCPCGRKQRGRYDTSRRRWRHLDFGACQVWLEADIHRIDCRGCGRVRTEELPWARPGARHSRDFEDVIAWPAQRMDKTSVSRLMRCSWEAVDRIVGRVVVEHVDDARLEDVYRIGVDEISYKRGHKYLTVVADHDTRKVIWVQEGRDKEAFEKFFDTLGDERSEQVEAITMDGSGIYRPVAEGRAPQAEICMDPFHVIKWVNEAVDRARTAQAAEALIPSAQWRSTRAALRKGAENLTDKQRDIINQLRRTRYRLWRAWELKEEFRDVYRVIDPDEARTYLKSWCTRALRSRIPSMRNLVQRIRNHFDAIIAAIELGLSNSLLEGINSKIRVIQRRGYGHSPESLSTMIYLCLSGITITLPTER